ncbi:MAG: DUF2587 domain-containing protein [Actinobacteria bacterium]|nr:DUF2587 domain-containing protein [Actinomycetota bacterium]NIS33660.1 DUF2587 domain-containing protein [Actinomycetota bacterium]NIT97014.1 DUF2587 domain-containing protein [Actinomycetota bacterium]NIU20679.1 DUF2587 domain-containing protein [Actinomycetota bacterium]NIU68516.1 DUF2587 domain-containing protein [Actinomycetota bacterium]
MTDTPTSVPSDHVPPDGDDPIRAEVSEVLDTLPVSGDGDAVDETVDHPAKVMRIGTMMKQLLEELRSSELDEPSRDRLRDIYDTSVTELGSALSPDLRDELGRLALPFEGDEVPTAAELQIAKAQLVGWLEGLVQGMQAMLFAQQMAAQQQLQSMRGQIGPGPGPGPEAFADDRPGTYL